MPLPDVIVVEVVTPTITVDVNQVGVPGASPETEVSISLTYNVDGTVATLTSSKGTKTFNYSGGKLVSIIGTGEYPTKTFEYTGDQLTAVTVS